MSRLKHHGTRGFTILEMAVVLAIVGALVTAGLGMGASALKAADRVITQERLATIKTALDAYAKNNGYLPCPANRAETPTANPTTFGREIRPCAASAPGIVRVSAMMDIGMVPVRSLGLPDNFAADAWGTKFTYAVTVALETSYATGEPRIAVFSGDRTAYVYNTASTNRATKPSVAASLVDDYGAAYVVVSHGPDKRGGYPLKRTTVGVACGAGTEIDVENCNDDRTFFDSDYNDGAVTAKYFDDYVVWGSNSLDRAMIDTSATTCTGSCEGWCAPCSANLPVTTPAAPASFTTDTAVLCEKFITSTSPCQATCVWAGTITTGTKGVRCP